MSNLKLEEVFLEIKKGIQLKSVDLSNCSLTTFPTELFALSECLESLNMGGNHLSSLPEQMVLFTKLRILFFAQNHFEEIPVVLGKMQSLYMLSFKSNRLSNVPPESLSPSVGWLILTDNKITALPPSIGMLSTLRKLMLSCNQIETLPDELQNCRELELVRLASNKIKNLPIWFLRLPKLSWLAHAGNPLFPPSTVGTLGVTGIGRLRNEATEASAAFRKIQYSELVVGDKLGEGASGTVYKADWHTHTAATALDASSSCLFSAESGSNVSMILLDYTHHKLILNG